MENDPRLQNSQPGRIHYKGKKIGYFPESGLFLFNIWKHVPIEFVSERIPDLIMDDKIVEGLPLVGSKYLSFEYIEKGHRKIEIRMDDGGIKILHVKREEHRNVFPRFIYSYDGGYEYYIIVKDIAPKKYFREICKFNGDELVYSTGEIPPNYTTYCGKLAVVDSKGTIYYYAGDENGIQIFRWKLQ